MSDNTASAGPVLVCITPQRSCAQLIKSGEMIALKTRSHLKVLAVFAKKNGADKENSAILEELYEAARMSDATMSVYFNDSPDILAAVVAAKESASAVVTGFPRENSSGFVNRLHDLVPAIPIIMIDPEGTEHRILPEKPDKAK
ncbi:MAG: hypothetical protein J5562_09450 [Clostridia bacterium]|nr:hypothetical protein [Clostridia bacterium]